MGMISIDAIQPGMVLAASVANRNGRVLVDAGTAIGEREMRILKMWGVTEADVEGLAQEDVASQALASVNPDLLRRAEEQTQRLFRYAPVDHPAMKELARLATMRFVQQLEKEAGHVI